MDEESRAPSPGRNPVWEMICFFVPIALQAMSMTLTYPLVASVVSHGPLGTSEYAVFAQGQTLMFLVGSVGGGLVTTGMVFARSKTGYRNFCRLSTTLGLLAAVLQLLCCLPPFDSLVFSRCLNLTGEVRDICRWTLLASIPMNFSFFVRNPYFATLLSEKQSVKAACGPGIRVVLTLLLSSLFVRIGYTGWLWGAILASAMVILETSIFRFLALPYVRRLEDTPENEKASVRKQFFFTLPLSLGGILLQLSTMMIAVFLGMTQDAIEITLPIHYIAMGIVTPISGGALRMQNVTIAFPPEKYGAGTVQRFAIGAGLALSFLTLVFRIPAVAQWYFGGVQNLKPERIPLACEAVLVLVATPLLQSLRCHAEGMAALRRRPNTILSGQAMYLATLVIVLFFLVRSAIVPGYLMGCIALLCALVAAFLTMRLALLSNDIADTYGVSHARRTDQ